MLILKTESVLDAPFRFYFGVLKIVYRVSMLLR